MTEAINCPSCGASNQLPKGKNSMFCSFCGNAIEKKISISINNSTNLKKSKILNNTLSFVDRNIESLDEIINLYSDSELASIDYLTLSNNKIKSLKGLSRFNPERIDISNNDLNYIDELPTYGSRSILSDYYTGTIIFDNNKNLLGFSSNLHNYLSKFKLSLFQIRLVGCDNFDYHSLPFNDFKKMLENNSKCQIFITVEPNRDLSFLTEHGFIKYITTDSKLANWVLNNTPVPEKKSGCFIATATMGSYNHPEVIELRNFRDNWILKKSWGESFVKWYYYYGEIAAKSIEKSFVLKKFCYVLIVKPLVYLARIVEFK